MIKQMLMACVGCGLIVANGNAQTRDDSLGGQVKGLYSGIREHKLANGLRVVFFAHAGIFHRDHDGNLQGRFL